MKLFVFLRLDVVYFRTHIIFISCFLKCELNSNEMSALIIIIIISNQGSQFISTDPFQLLTEALQVCPHMRINGQKPHLHVQTGRIHRDFRRAEEG